MRKFYILSLIALAGIIIGFAWAEQITLTTYYPAPYGVYREFTTTSNTNLVTQEGNVGIGTASPNASAPNNQPGNLDVNDIYLRSTGQWVSGISGGGVAAPGTWCGLRMSAHGGPVFSCNGYDPAVSCPNGYHSVLFAVMGPLGGNWYTCVKN